MDLVQVYLAFRKKKEKKTDVTFVPRVRVLRTDAQKWLRIVYRPSRTEDFLVLKKWMKRAPWDFNILTMFNKSFVHCFKSFSLPSLPTGLSLICLQK